MLAALYARSTWPTLADALAAAAAGNGGPAGAPMDDTYTTGGPATPLDAETAIDCLDHPVAGGVAEHLPALAAQAAVKAPVFGPLLAWGEATCAVWPVPAHPRPRRRRRPWGRRPSWWWGPPRTRPRRTCGRSVWLRELQHGVLVTWQGENHVAYYYSACVRAIDQAYFVQARCRPRARCAATEPAARMRGWPRPARDHG